MLTGVKLKRQEKTLSLYHFVHHKSQADGFLIRKRSTTVEKEQCYFMPDMNLASKSRLEVRLFLNLNYWQSDEHCLHIKRVMFIVS
jgi:hypothetical protein